MQWRLGGDIGTNSLGWCAVELDADGSPSKIVALGSRIFGDGRDPDSKQSLAVERRSARAMRRGFDRFKQRQAALLKHSALAGLFPPESEPEARKALELLDPFALRARALHEALTPYEIGRALFHLNQRRGFKSNRRTDRTAEDGTGKIRIGVQRLQEAMRDSGASTFGEFLNLRRQSATDANHVPSVRARLRPEEGENAKGDGYDFYPDRALLEEEFDAIIEVQAIHHPTLLTESVCKTLFDVIFHQRKLRPAQVGMCTLIAGEERLPKAHPLFQRRRLLEEVNALRIVRAGETAQPLKLEHRNAVLLKLKDKKSVAFESLRTKVLKLDRDARFNKESENRKEIKGDEVATVMSDKKRFGPRWGFLKPDAQWAVINRIRTAESDADVSNLRAWLQTEYLLSPEQAIATIDSPLPEGFGRFGKTATCKLIEALETDVIVYSEAVARAGLGHHSDFRTGEMLDALPYYGEVLERHILPGSGDPNDMPEQRYGRITNPTVHIGLNQLRRVVNTLIRAYGQPTEIALELARDLKLSEDEKREINQRNARNREDAKRRSAKLGEIGVADRGSNRAIIKLWEELNRDNVLDRRCIYTGEMISANMLFSGAVEVDHILPFSATLDDSPANRLLCTRESNREKRKRSPYEAFGHTARWEAIAARAARLPREKRWRFEPDAIQRFEQLGGFLDRQLVDTQYLSRLAREYVSTLYPDRGEGSSHVWVSPGRLTEMLRRSWGLNGLLPDHNYGGGADQEKNRLDHRHHAIDAAVIAVTTRSLLQRISHESGLRGHDEARRITHNLPPPWEGFREELKAAVSQAVASHRPDHGTVSKAALPKGADVTAGRLHNDTAYGLTGREERGISLVVHRVPLTALKPEDLVDGGRRVADDQLRTTLAAATAGMEGKAFLQALIRFAETDAQFRGVRRVRVLEPLSVIPISNKQGRVYKAFKGGANYRYDVWELPENRWIAEVVSMFDAHQPGWISRIRQGHHNPRKVLSLHRDDLLAINRGSGRELMRVVKFSEKQLALASPNEGGALKARDKDKNDPFKYIYPSPNTLKAWGARQVRIDELGRVQDPGPRSTVGRSMPQVAE
jgi:CRISPR-associated endonuclease Csn1